jgi:hypothetical protein
MAQWRILKLQENYRCRFDEGKLRDQSIFEENQDYKLIVVYGKAGNGKSSLINMYTGGDHLNSGVNADGISKGVSICKRANIIIADTEGTGTDNSSYNRPDIVSLFCVCYSFVIVQALHNRFPLSEIQDTINQILAYLQRIYKSNPSNMNKPSLLILCPIHKFLRPELIEKFKQEALNFKVAGLPQNLIEFFSAVEISVLSPLSRDVIDMIDQNDRFQVSSVPQNHLDEVRGAFNSVINKSQPGKKGSSFMMLNSFYDLAQSNKMIDPLVFERCLEFTEAKLKAASNTIKLNNCNFDLYKTEIQTFQNNINSEIDRLNIEATYKSYYKNKFNDEFLKWQKNHGDMFNELLIIEIEKIFEIEKDSIIKSIQNLQESFSYNNLVNLISRSKGLINGIRHIELANNSEKKQKVRNLISLKVSNLNDYDFEAIFINYRIAKPIQKTFFDQRIQLIDVTFVNKLNKINQLKQELNQQIDKSINDFYNNNKINKKNRSNIINECLENFVVVCTEYYQNNFHSNHLNCLNIIERERSAMVAYIRNIPLDVHTYNSRIIDDFSRQANTSESRFRSSINQKYYDMYYDEFYNQVFVNNYSAVSSTSVRSCIYSYAYHQCPDCGNIWEQRMEGRMEDWIGCGNYACYGKTIGCSGRSFRTKLKEGNSSNKMARALTIEDVKSMCNTELSSMERLTLNQLNAKAWKK